MPDRIVDTAPAVKLIKAAWTVTGGDGTPFTLWLPDRSRCWSYFTKPAARRYATEIGGYIEGPSSARTYKDAVL